MRSVSEKLHVFISYARVDGSEFASSLFAALEAAGFDPFLDRHDIVPGEPWEARLTRLLQEADTVVYVITPGAVNSERCAWEIQEAHKLAKRVIPVVAVEVSMADLPRALGSLNTVFFTRDLSFGEALRQLAVGLRTDTEWVREHTRIAEAAGRWRLNGENQDLLWRSEELANANSWMASWNPAKPQVTIDQRAFIQAGGAAEDLRTSDERRKIAELKSANEARETALKRQSRATRIAFLFAACLILATGLGGGFVYMLSLHVQKLQTEAQDLGYENDQLRASLSAQQDDLKERAVEFNQDVKKVAQNLDAAQPPVGEMEEGATVNDEGARAAGKDERAPEFGAVDLQRITQARWNIDIFWCAGSGAVANRARGAEIEAALVAEKNRQASVDDISGTMALGRIRLRDLSEEVNAKRGYEIREDIMRPEAGETRQADELVAMLERAGAPVPSKGLSTTPTPQYLSVFICKSS